MYAASVAMPAPTIPYDGISARQSAKFTAAAIPVITQLNCVRRVRPTPIAMTMYAEYAVVPNASSPTTSAPAQKRCGCGQDPHDPRREHAERRARARTR